MSEVLLEKILGELHGIRGEIQGVRTELKEEIQGVRTELKEEIQGVRTELLDKLKVEIQGVRTELKEEIQGVRTELKTEIKGLRTELLDKLTEYQLENIRSDEVLLQTIRTVEGKQDRYIQMTSEQFSTHEHSIEILHRNQLKFETELNKLKAKIG